MGFQIGICRRRNKRYDRRKMESFESANEILEANRVNAQFKAQKEKIETIRLNQTATVQAGKEDEKLIDTIKMIVKKFCQKNLPNTKNVTNTSLYFFSKTNRLRLFMLSLTQLESFFMVIDCLVLAMYSRLLYWSFRESKWIPYDGFGIFCGIVILAEILVNIVAYGLVGHTQSYLLKNPFNLYKFLLAVLYFVDSMHFLQVVQCFRVFSVMSRFAVFRSMYEKTNILKKSMVSLVLLVAIYLLMLFFFSVICWVMFYRYMGKFCIDPAVGIEALRKVQSSHQPIDLWKNCQSAADCGAGMVCIDIKVRDFLKGQTVIEQSGSRRLRLPELPISPELLLPELPGLLHDQHQHNHH